MNYHKEEQQEKPMHFPWKSTKTWLKSKKKIQSAAEDASKRRVGL